MADILLFVPTYNERDNAPRMARELAALAINADILFVDDNSPDGTGKLLEELKSEIPRLIVHHRSGKLGIGTAHAEAIAWAYSQGYKILVTLDCDFTHSPTDIPVMISTLGNSDLLVGSRWVRRKSLPGWNIFRRAMTFLGHFLTKFVLGIPQDASGAFRAYNLGQIRREVFSLVRSKSYAFFFESMFVFNRNRLSIIEIPITLPARTYGNSKMSTQAAINSARYIFELALNNLRRPEQFLLPASNLKLDNSIQDPQNWDAYWNESGETGNPIYETIAGVYRRLIIKRNLEKAILREFKLGSILLHAGCGSGQVDTAIQHRMKITALDISKGALALYSKNNTKVSSIVHGSIFNLPFPDGTFDGIYNLGVMEHFNSEEINGILKEFHRVIKPGGKILLFWPHARATSVLILGLCHKFLRSALKSDRQLHPAEISLIRNRRQSSDFLNSAGFRLVRYKFGFWDFWVQAIIVGEKS